MDGRNEEKCRKRISSFPEFAEIFLFLQIFGPLINLSAVTLKALEDFFIDGRFKGYLVTIVFALVVNLR